MEFLLTDRPLSSAYEGVGPGSGCKVLCIYRYIEREVLIGVVVEHGNTGTRRQNAEGERQKGRWKTEDRTQNAERRTQNAEGTTEDRRQMTEEKTQTEGRDDAHVGRDVPGGDPVHLHVLPAPFVAERLGQLPERALGRGVRRHCEPALKAWTCAWKRRSEVEGEEVLEMEVEVAVEVEIPSTQPNTITRGYRSR